jgi:hypothetical protein
MLRRRWLAGLALVAALTGAVASSAPATAQISDPTVPPIEGPSLGELKDELKEIPSGTSLSVVVTAKPGHLIDESFYGDVDAPGIDSAVTVVQVETEAEAQALLNDPAVAKIQTEDMPLDPSVISMSGTADQPIPDELSPQNEVPGQASVPGDGSGTAIAILDTGFDMNEQIITANSKVIAERCSVASGVTACPNGQTTMTGSGAADYGYCKNMGSVFATGCSHGTAVATTAAGYNPGQSSNGVAHNANLILIRVGYWNGTSTQISNNGAIDALDWLYDNIVLGTFGSTPVVAANMSFGSGSYASDCDSVGSAMLSVVNDVRSRTVVVTASAGNSTSTNAMSYPACVTPVVSVAGTDANPFIWSLTNISGRIDTSANSFVSFWANGQQATGNGTSFSSPRIAGVVSLLATPDFPNTLDTADILERESAIRYSGEMVSDTRSGGIWGVKQLNAETAWHRLFEIVTHNNAGASPLDTYRVLDTRNGFGVDRGYTAINQLSGTWEVRMTEKLGLDVSQIKAVMLNVTVVNATATGKVAVGAGPISSPAWTNIPVYSGMPATAVHVWSDLDNDGDAGFYLSSGAIDVIVDVVGVMGASADTSVLATPQRAYSTVGGANGGAIGPNTARVWDPRGVGGVPSSGVRAIVGTLTYISVIPAAGAFLSALPADYSTVNVSTLNPPNATSTKSNLTIIPLATTGGNAGKVVFYNYSGYYDVTFDVVGYINTGATDITPSTVTRVWDTRPSSPMSSNQEYGMGWTSAACGGSEIGTMNNLTLIAAVAGSFGLLWRFQNQPAPTASTVNAGAGEIVPNAAVVDAVTGPGLKNYGAGNHYAIDIVGCIN